ncbi:hypothetical protein C8R46DRAFT_1060901 [Mycena filopes]|nr:hypothetical protein C8R46DRAFT_1060901 [Mycena filopes]
MPESLHAYLPSRLRASRSSHDLNPPRPPPDDSYPLRSLSARHHPTSTLSVPNLRTLPPSPGDSRGNSPYSSANSSVVDFGHLNAAQYGITEGTYSLHSLSVSNLPGALPAHNPPATISVEDLRTLGGHFESTDAGFVDINVPLPEDTLQTDNVAMPSPIAPILREHNARIFPGLPGDVKRYERNVVIPDEPTHFTLPPGANFNKVPAPPGWTLVLHPEGAPYFFHEEKRVFTDANLFNMGALLFIDTQMDSIFEFLRTRSIVLRPNVDLVLEEYTYSDGSNGCQYYFVDHNAQSVFWFDEVASEEFSVIRNLNGVKSATHICYILQKEYWDHCDLFPKSLKLKPEILDEVRDLIFFARGDLATSRTSTVDFNVTELHEATQIIDGFSSDYCVDLHLPLSNIHLFALENNNRNLEHPSDKFSCIVARLMSGFAKARILQFCGEPGARLNSNQSVYGRKRQKTFFIKLLAPLLLNAPSHHFQDLDSTFTDNIIRQREWSEFLDKLSQEWGHFTLYSTVVLTANVGFLAIQSVDQGGYLVLNRSPAQLASYLSVMYSIGSIMLGLLLVTQYRNAETMSSAEASQFMYKHSSVLGLEKLAVLYSLPYALLMWSVALFVVALSFLCFQHSSFVTRMLVGIVSLIVGALIFWCIFVWWQGTDWSWLKHPFNLRWLKYRAKVERDTASTGGVSSSSTLVSPWKWASSLTRKVSRRESDRSSV